MPRLIFAALAAVLSAHAVAAQQVPGRDLLEFPVGALAEPRASTTRMPGGLWNPAAAALSPSTRAAFGLAGVTTPQEQGVQVQMVAAEYLVKPTVTASLSFVQASVSDILKTETDPQSLGAEIRYGTSLLSAAAAARRSNLTFGVATRYRWAELDTEHSGVLSIDGGAIADHVGGTPARIAVSTFLFSPSRKREAATYLAA